MKRYLLFTGYNYYPSGGWDDFNSAWDTLEEAKDAGEVTVNTGADWAHIVDIEYPDDRPVWWSQTKKGWNQ